jgi:hypothetical protein
MSTRPDVHFDIIDLRVLVHVNATGDETKVEARDIVLGNVVDGVSHVLRVQATVGLGTSVHEKDSADSEVKKEEDKESLAETTTGASNKTTLAFSLTTKALLLLTRTHTSRLLLELLEAHHVELNVLVGGDAGAQLLVNSFERHLHD